MADCQPEDRIRIAVRGVCLRVNECYINILLADVIGESVEFICCFELKRMLLLMRDPMEERGGAEGGLQRQR